MQTNKPRHYKTRKSPIDAVWATELEPMLRKNPTLQPKTLLIHLQRTHINAQGEPIYTESVERTLQRKVARWLALNGQEKPVFFPQAPIPGEQGLSDFTHFNNPMIMIKGEPFKPMFYHFRLVYSKWSYLKVIQSGESMQALSEGLQEALYALGGAPKTHRTDSLSAAFKNLSVQARDDLTRDYEQLCAYYQMLPTRNNKGQSHENGSVESAHGHLKNRIAQELLLRGHHHFDSIAEYEQWIHAIVVSNNKRRCVDFETEQLALQPLPKYKTNNYELKSVKVSSLSILTVRGMRYSVPSRLSGHTLTLHIYQHQIDVYSGSTFVFHMERKYRHQHRSMYVIDYRHVIHALVKKPAAFRRCKYRDELLPSAHYQTIWHYLEQQESREVAPKLLLRLLKLAADCDCEQKLAEHIIHLIDEKMPIVIEDIEKRFNNHHRSFPDITCHQHAMTDYDFIINQATLGAQDATT